MKIHIEARLSQSNTPLSVFWRGQVPPPPIVTLNEAPMGITRSIDREFIIRLFFWQFTRFTTRYDESDGCCFKVPRVGYRVLAHR